MLSRRATCGLGVFVGALACLIGGAASATSGTISLVRDDGPNGYTGIGGGEFGVTQFSGMAVPPLGAGVAVGSNLFQTFCMETGQHLDGQQPFNWTLETAVDGDPAMPLKPQTAYLYTQFWNGALVPSYDYALGGPITQDGNHFLTARELSARDLQFAIWFLQGELPSVSGRAQAWVDAADAAVAGAWGNTIGNVRVLSLTDGAGVGKQDVLVLTSEPDVCATSSLVASFNGTAIPAGDCVWFNSVLKPSGVPKTGATIHVFHQKIHSSAFDVDVPDSVITFSPSATTATTTFDGVTNTWLTTVPTSYTGNIFMAGALLHLPTGLAGGLKNVSWSADFSMDPDTVTFKWQWAAAAYDECPSDLASLGVKPVDDNKLSAYQNSDHAGTPETIKTSVLGGARGGGGSNFTGSYSGTAAVKCAD